MSFVPGVETPAAGAAVRGPLLELADKAQALIEAFLPLFPSNAPDDAWQPVGDGGARLTLGRLRSLQGAVETVRISRCER